MEGIAQSSRGADADNKFVNQSLWDEDTYGRSPSVSDLRVGGLRRRVSSACCLNVFLLLALLIAIAVIMYFLISPISGRTRPPVKSVVSTFCGIVQGTESNGVVSFLGLPYALPPLGQYRFKRPVELTTTRLCAQAWATNNFSANTNSYNATVYKSSCLQLSPVTDKVIGNEDCLYLNVFVPAMALTSSKTELRPVIVVLNGLFFTYGGASGLPVSQGQQPQPRTVELVDAIHVTLNYRIGPLGFLMHPETKEANIGLYDQLAALRWVRNNIGAFGGDAARVTLFGYGSGATCALALAFSSLGQNLFDNLWISAPAVRKPHCSLQEAVENSRRLYSCEPGSTRPCSNGLLADPKDIVRLWNWARIESWMKDTLFSLPSFAQIQGGAEQDWVDRILIVDHEMIDPKRWYRPIYHLSTVLGQTAHETALFVSPITVPFWDESFYRRYLINTLTSGTKIGQDMIDQYLIVSNKTTYCSHPSSSNSFGFDVEARMTGLITDARCTCPLAETVQQLASSHGNFVYHYYLFGQHRRFDPYSFTSFVSLSFHGWDGMVYLRGYTTHPDYIQSMLDQNDHDHMEDLGRQSDLLNTVMHEFSRTGRILSWNPVEPGNAPVNLIENGAVCTPPKFVEERCRLWKLVTNGNPLDLAWRS
ncbi:para-nitrobenzyl esterase [Clonorchis sinensis]|uniref:Para-nitrobenzyl esterase n=1 Tax=Clonorchis sinensis TaxID=79923 RepID=H2KU15_CLOSI|nr:para-nitrobenzyl esterase [Clonorchis sinensis]